MKPAVTLRPLTIADLAAVVAAETEVFAEDPWTPGMIADELASPIRYYVGAFRDADDAPPHLVGWAGVSLGPDADVMTIGVLPDCRGVGVGALLMESLLGAARSAQAERVFLEVRSSNEVAQRLYERHGFRQIGRVKNYFRNPREDAVTMRADLKI